MSGDARIYPALMARTWPPDVYLLCPAC